MKPNNIFYIPIVFLFIHAVALAQTDSISKLSYVNFMSLVKKNHPVAKQADLILKSASANELSARGSFDPRLYYNFKNKYYDSKNYYSLSDGGFRIPTWFGAEFKGGYENNDGTYLNPENYMPDNGLIYAQVSLPVLQGLLIDERRATLKQAGIFKDLSEIEKTNILNKLLFEAGKMYWEWNLSYSNLEVFNNALTISRERFEAVNKSSQMGDRPYIDTVEANIQLQERMISVQQALTDYRNKTLQISNFLWTENESPIELTEKTIPETGVNNSEIFFQNILGEIDSMVSTHPELKRYEFKEKELTIEEKLKRNKLLPVLNINYNPLFNTVNENNNYFDNYKWGVTMSFPVFLRKERGDLQLTRLKLLNNELETKNKRNELLTKTKVAINEYNNLRVQVEIYERNVNNYERLWQAEKKLFESGESSVFMINSRELSFINAKIKLNELINKNNKSALEAEYSFGILNSNY